jgi:hypothetical protein
MIDTNQNRACKVCGKEVVNYGTDGIAHASGGTVEQVCKNPSCGWRGGQYGKFSQCPRCSDQTSLVDDHVAS